MIVVRTSAQLSFFVKPSINLKSDVSSSQPFEFSDYSLNPSPFYHYDNIAVHSLFRGLDLGLTLGAVSKSKKYIYEVGFCGDETQSGYRLHRFLTNESFYYQSNVKYIYGRSFPRIFCQSSIRLKEFSTKSNLYLLFGVSISKKHSTVLGTPIGEVGETVKVDDKTFLERESALYVMSLNNQFIHLGLTSEIHSKKSYLFDINLFYNHGFKMMSQVITSLTLYDEVNYQKIHYNSYSNGSGIYLQFARKFQVYPLRPNKKKGI